MPRKTVDARALAVTAVMTAIVFVLTSMIRVTTPARGYIHLGDAASFSVLLPLAHGSGLCQGGLALHWPISRAAFRSGPPFPS